MCVVPVHRTEEWRINGRDVMYRVRTEVSIPRAAWVTREEAVSASNPLPHGLPGCPWVASGHGGTFQQASMCDHHGRRMAPWTDRAKADRLGRYRIPKPARPRANGRNGGRQKLWASLQVDNDRVSIKLKLPKMDLAPETRYSTGGHGYYPVAVACIIVPPEKSCHFGILERKLGEPHSSVEEIRAPRTEFLGLTRREKWS